MNTQDLMIAQSAALSGNHNVSFFVPKFDFENEMYAKDSLIKRLVKSIKRNK